MKIKKRMNIWDIIAWIALASIILWVTLKILGVMNTPLWLEYAPIYSASYVAGWAMHKLSVMSEEVNSLKKFRDETISQINDLKLNCIKNHNKK